MLSFFRSRSAPADRLAKRAGDRAPMENQNQDAARSPGEVPNDPGYVLHLDPVTLPVVFLHLIVMFILQEDVRRRTQLAD